MEVDEFLITHLHANKWIFQRFIYRQILSRDLAVTALIFPDQFGYLIYYILTTMIKSENKTFSKTKQTLKFL